MASILWAVIPGLLALLLFGVLLTLFALLLPRLALLWESREARRLDLRELEPAPMGQTELGVPLTPPPLERPVTPPAPEVSPPSWAQAPEEPLVAAAIALALALFQGELAESRLLPRGSEGGSPWALAGRWQAMQARLRLPKR